MTSTKLYFVFIGLALFNNVANAQNMSLEDLNLGGIDLDSIPNLPENFMNPSDLATLEVTEAPAASTETEAPTESAASTESAAPTVSEAATTEEPASPPPATDPTESATEAFTNTVPANKLNGIEYTFNDGNINAHFSLSTANKKEPSTPPPAPAGDVKIIFQEILYHLNKIISSGDANAAANKIQQQQLDEIKKLQEELKTLQAGIQTGIPNNLFRRLFRAIPAFHDAARRALQQAVANLSKRREAIREASKAIFNAGKTIIDGKIDVANAATGVLQETADAFSKDTDC